MQKWNMLGLLTVHLRIGWMAFHEPAKPGYLAVLLVGGPA